MVFIKIFKGKYRGVDMHLKAIEGYTLLNPEASEASFYYEDKKPRLTNGLYVSVSHSGEYSLIAYSTSPVGIDIEKIKDVDYKKLGAKFGSQCQALQDFFKEWTYREARFKAYGVALFEKNDDYNANYYNFIEGYQIAVVGSGEVVFSIDL